MIDFWFLHIISAVSSEPHPVILNMKAALSPETSERTYYSRSFNNQDHHLNNAFCDTLKTERSYYFSRLHTGLCIRQIHLLTISAVCCNSRLLKLWNFIPYISPLKTKSRLLYLKTQSVPRCKHFSSRS